nr:response regulator [uncultured Steroidobacter sp.]
MSELDGLRVLVVEDEGPVALLIEDMLLELGCELAASAADVDEACRLAASENIDFALLDLNIGGCSSLPAAQILHRRGIPFVFSTGYGVSRVPAEFQSYPSLAKPYVLSDLEAKILLALDRSPRC